MKKHFIYIIVLLLIFSFAVIHGNSSKFSKSTFGFLTKDSANAPLCGVQSDTRYYFFNQGLYEFSIADASAGSAKYSICIEGTEASGRCKEDNFNSAWRFYVDKDLSIAVWRSMRVRVQGDDGKMHSVYGAPEETTIVKDRGTKNWKDWTGSLLKWQEADSTGKVTFRISIKVKKIK